MARIGRGSGSGYAACSCAALAGRGERHRERYRRLVACWFGLTPKERSSGGLRKLGRISKQGDRYLRMLLTHGARSVLRASAVTLSKGNELTGIRRWAIELQQRSNHNKATCALVNKLARICYGVLRDHAPFGAPAIRLGKKMHRQAFELAH